MLVIIVLLTLLVLVGCLMLRLGLLLVRRLCDLLCLELVLVGLWALVGLGGLLCVVTCLKCYVSI